MKMVSCSGQNEFTTSTLVSICLEALTIQTNVKKGLKATVRETYQRMQSANTKCTVKGSLDSKYSNKPIEIVTPSPDKLMPSSKQG